MFITMLYPPRVVIIELRLRLLAWLAFFCLVVFPQVVPRALYCFSSVEDKKGEFKNILSIVLYRIKVNELKKYIKVL